MKNTLLLLMVFFITTLSAQSLKESALEKFNNQQWEEAAKDYLKYLKENEGDSSDWYLLAISKSRLNEYKDAIKYFTEAKELNYNAGRCYWGIAKSYALLDEKDNAMASLSKGAENGLAALTQLASDPAFATYQELKPFKKILKKVELNAYPCLSAKNYRHFDFWLGEWEVFVNGNKTGENSITMATGGCAVHESYTTAGNYAGQSINYYDPIGKKWHQHWVGSGGDTYNYLEVDKGEGMLQFESKFMTAAGNITLSRLTFTLQDDGSVRQLFESSSDEGTTWSSAFDGIYKKKE